MNLLALAICVGSFGAIGVRQLTGRGPEIWVLLLAGGGLTVAAGVLTPSGAASALAGEIPVFAVLFALFVFVAALDRAGAFEHIARWILGRAGRAEELPLLLFVGFGAIASVVLNDALVLIGVPLMVALARRLGTASKPMLLVLAYAVTVGSVATPLGNPQNLLVGLDSGLSAPIGVFLRYLALPTAINLLLGGLYLRWSFRRVGGSGASPAGPTFPRLPLLPTGGWAERLRRSPVLVIFPITLGALVVLGALAEGAGLRTPPSDEIAMGGAIALLVLSAARERLLERVDWTVLLLFVGLFLLVGGAVSGGLLGPIEAALPVPGPSSPAPVGLGAIVGSSLLGPQLVSNVPWVALEIPVLRGLGYGASTPIAWMALAGGSTLAGNLTLLGAASNLIVVEQAERRGISIRLGEFVRHGLPLTAITTATLLLCLVAGV